MRRIFAQMWGVIVVGIFFVPFVTHAFQLTPAVIDVDLGDEATAQTITVTNTEADERTYRAELQRVTFAPDGTISGLEPGNFGESLRVSPETLTLPAQSEGTFEVAFGSRHVLFDQRIVALLVTETSGDALVHGGATTLFFLHDAERPSGSFTIDAFAVTPGDDAHAFEARALYTNTGTETVSPVATIVVTNMFGREMRWFPFHPGEGRLPVGTSRTLMQDLVLVKSPWHIGGPITFTLMVADEAGEQVQTRAVTQSSLPGMGAFGAMMIFFVSLLWGTWYFLRKRRVY